jgi:hypothetical protein
MLSPSISMCERRRSAATILDSKASCRKLTPSILTDKISAVSCCGLRVGQNFLGQLSIVSIHHFCLRPVYPPLLWFCLRPVKQPKLFRCYSISMFRVLCKTAICQGHGSEPISVMYEKLSLSPASTKLLWASTCRSQQPASVDCRLK